MMMRCIFCTLASVILFSLMLSLVHAQPLPAPAPQVKKKIVYKEKSYYDFEDTLINGNVRKPDGSFIFRKEQNSFSSALNLRRSFIPELRESSHDAR